VDTIYALSSGQPPAAIAIVRVSGPHARAALHALTSTHPEPRRAVLARLTHEGELLDQAVVIYFDGPNTATGDDLVELHLHGGRAVVTAVLRALADLPHLRAATPGEFTRHAFENGRIDLAEAEGLADLLAAETESQRRLAVRMAGGALSRLIGNWAERLLMLAAAVEARLDFGDEGDVDEELPGGWHADLDALVTEIAQLLGRPPSERLRDGIRVVIGGPPNAGKSTLLNAIVGREAAITSEVAGTTRDVIEAPVAIAGVPFLFVDTAGLRDSSDAIEQVGVDRAAAAIAGADLVLWLGSQEDAPAGDHVLLIEPKADVQPPRGSGLAVSARTGAGIGALLDALISRARNLLPGEVEVSANARQRAELALAREHLQAAGAAGDLLIVAEELRQARLAFDRVTGRAGVENMLDALFGRFCIGK
jgi:tRNA modification GTPase